VLLADRTATPGAYGVNAYPTLVSVDREGKVVEYLIGGRGEPELRGVIAKARAGAMPEVVAVKKVAAAPAPAAVAGSRKLLPAPRQLSPAADAEFEHFPRETTVVWSEVPGASAYLVEWDYKQSDGWSVDRQGVVSTIRVTEPVTTFRFVGAQPGRWRVTALDASGDPGERSPWREFRYTK
jgi:hypothetical protein